MSYYKEATMNQLYLILFTFIGNVHGSVPHTHTGKFEGYSPSQLLAQHLDAQAEQVLEKGGVHKHYLDGDHSNRFVMIQNVNAPPNAVLKQIVDYNNYSKKVPQTLESEIYGTNRNDKKEIFFARLKCGMRGFSTQFFIKSEYHKNHNSVVWRLDYDHLSDIDEACGCWRAEPHPSSPNEKTRLYCSVDMSLGSRVPRFVASFITKKAVRDAVAWVKKQSEKTAQNVF
mmetsp:Transcript_32825/g.49506  ORF Transcript_32825/g.49506 Transcript_32825/m.49506 type:complete len:228 (+) Transcript_32825:267-950(+)